MMHHLSASPHTCWDKDRRNHFTAHPHCRLYLCRLHPCRPAVRHQTSRKPAYGTSFLSNLSRRPVSRHVALQSYRALLLDVRRGPLANDGCSRCARAPTVDDRLPSTSGTAYSAWHCTHLLLVAHLILHQVAHHRLCASFDKYLPHRLIVLCITSGTRTVSTSRLSSLLGQAFHSSYSRAGTFMSR